MSLTKANTRMLEGNLPNSQLENDSITINGSEVALGGSTTIATGGTNTPAFEAILSSDQAVSDNTLTKVAFNSETFDTDGKYDDSTNYRFTPTIAGKYFVYSQINGFAGADSDLVTINLQIRKNGSVVRFSFVEPSNNFGKTQTLNCSSILTLDSDDYVEIFASIDGNSNGGEVIQGSATSGTIFGAYKLIGA